MSNSPWAAAPRALDRLQSFAVGIRPNALRASTPLRAPVAAAMVIVGFVLLRLIAAHYIGLGTDESYSVAVARDLRASYFDHPPMHYWIAHAVEPLLGVGRASRIPFILLFALTSWLMFSLTRRLFGEWAGFWAVLALNLSAFFTVAAGSWVLPDGPLICALMAATTILAESWFGEQPQPIRPLIAWIGAGLFIGLAGLSKYQAALYCVGLGLFLLTADRGRRQLLSPGPYLAAAIVLLVLSPVLTWNAAHGWASFAFQAGRGAPQKLNLAGPPSALMGQMGLLLPWIFIPMAAAGVSALRAGPLAERRWFCVILALPAIAVFTLAPLAGPVGLPHWSMAGWLFLFPLLGDFLARAAQTRTWPRRWAAGSALFILIAGVLMVSDAATGWLGADFPRLFRRGDPTAEMVDWTPLRTVVGGSAVLRRPGAFVAALKWNEGGKVDQAVGDLAPVAVLSSDPRQFGYRLAPASLVGHDALIVGKLDTINNRLADLAPYFRSLTPLAPVTVGRGRGEITLGVVEARGLLRPYGSAPPRLP
ncbi:MAG: glycosyltransferase family 39 protein [Caulobacteraceae bacterium]|nr:glycosyltransferase family 39 protein [Caulobacteraceae bacterium]